MWVDLLDLVYQVNSLGRLSILQYGFAVDLCLCAMCLEVELIALYMDMSCQSRRISLFLGQP